MDFVLNGFNLTFSEETQSWDFTSLPLDSSDKMTAEAQGSGFYYFMVPSSLFFGLHPTTLGDTKVWSDKKQRDEMLIKVFNPAEDREQEEKFVEAKATGIILRGTNSFGWASSDMDTSGFPEFLHMWKGDVITIADVDAVPEALKTAAQATLDAGKDFPNSYFNDEHWQQLQGVASGGGETFEALVKTFQKVLTSDPTAQYELVPRTYAGGVLRLTCTMDHVVKSLVPQLENPKDGEPAPIVTVDEMWGGKTLEYDPEKASSILIGAELANNGKPRYVRISFLDGPPGGVYFRSVSL